MKQEEREILKECRALLEGARSLVLATADEAGVPLASYAPFIRDEAGNLHLLVSGLARHAANLERGRASAMIIQDEAQARQLFARLRLTLDCDVEAVPRGEAAAQIVERMAERLGGVVELLSALPDFVLYRLRPRQGVFVRGFGKAYRVDPALTTLSPVEPRR